MNESTTGPLRDGAVDAGTLSRWLDDGEPVWLVHASDPASFRRAHLPGAMCFAEVAQAAVILHRDDRVVVYDPEGGGRDAASWAAELRSQGFTRTSWLRDGLAGWRRSGGKLEGADTSSTRGSPPA